MIYRVFLFLANLKLFIYIMKIINRLQKLRLAKKVNQIFIVANLTYSNALLTFFKTLSVLFFKHLKL